jgi:hypothetical protein
MDANPGLRAWTPEDRARIWSPGRGTAKTRTSRVELAQYVRSITDDGRVVAQFMLAVMSGKKIKMGKGNVTPSLRHAMAAAEWLANRAFGLPKESIELVDGDTRAERMTLLASMSAEDREQLRALMVRAIEARTMATPPAVTPAPAHAGDAAAP